MRNSTLCFRISVLFVIAGMLWGLQMGITEDHSTLPAHAHLNLLGWVSLFLFGVYYRLHPALEHSRLALAQVWIWIFGTIVMVIGVGLIFTGHDSGNPFAAAGSIIVIVAGLMFAWLVYRSEHAGKS